MGNVLPSLSTEFSLNLKNYQVISILYAPFFRTSNSPILFHCPESMFLYRVAIASVQ